LLVLVDTSVWLAFLKGRATTPVGYLRSALDKDLPVSLTAFIYQEILQGADSEKAFQRLRRFFAGQRMLEPTRGLDSYERAARIYFDCRRLGITVRSTIDCLVAQIAIEHDALLLHDDRDYHGIARAVPQLRLVPP
jgi:predicted nucleic acid-binding protein